ncbi:MULTISPECIES: 50S ribosomal protein L11 methyltransferase [unclassified Nodularia (in: cyanobacteria)]|uniref:50S ribosomal protein L11 methyltransferase n=1 Tax=unclassified Nodularia (in: cyanobacteria) TaxID=2656917 RepID=UPI00187E9833|nr:MULTISPECIES: 50S ribosomal protein L11 methyltransferase [unclassified Nodularia (in: cyanobacteria)]MBE9201429.1 50S ribosomal protein L11 methyltransferase [Nodularia sp. LEGE 06071]MCC2691487.1 50S ribosomal protein L11 methyltransferase [Nodularia sp. LEGE 04288]
MSWMELSLDTTHEAVDWVCTLLAETIDINDIYITEYAESHSDNSDWTFTMRLYLPYDVSARTQIEKIESLLSPLHRTGMTTAIQTTVVENKITDAPKPLLYPIGERFIIVNSDTPAQSEVTDKITLKIQKTLAFGSGLHPATIVSLRLLERYIAPNMQVLDFGSGSGILSVAIAKLGANVLALDNDSVAVQATQETVSLNAVEQQVQVMQGSLGCGSDLGHWMGGNTVNNVSKIEAKDTFDLIVANIFARVHIALADDFREALRQNQTQPGLLITAGFTTDHEESVTTALTEAGFEVIDCERLNEWVALAHRCNL